MPAGIAGTQMPWMATPDGMFNLTVAPGSENWECTHQKGRQEGETLLLMRQLERKFGPLNETVRTRLQGANAETLLIWGEQVLTASSCV